MNVTGVIPSNETALTGGVGQSLILRRRTHSLFTFSTDFDFHPQQPNQEAGISVFLTQLNHTELAIAYIGNTSNMTNKPAVYKENGSPHSLHQTKGNLELRLRVETIGTEDSSIPYSLIITPMLQSWYQTGPIRLQVHTPNKFEYIFSAFPVNNPNDKIVLGIVPAYVVTLASGRFTGALVGAHATCNGAGGHNETRCPGEGGEAWFARWRYEGAAQEVGTEGLRGLRSRGRCESFSLRIVWRKGIAYRRVLKH